MLDVKGIPLCRWSPGLCVNLQVATMTMDGPDVGRKADTPKSLRRSKSCETRIGPTCMGEQIQEALFRVVVKAKSALVDGVADRKVEVNTAAGAKMCVPAPAQDLAGPVSMYQIFLTSRMSRFSR